MFDSTSSKLRSKKNDYQDEDQLDEILKNMPGGAGAAARGQGKRNKTYENIMADIEKQRRKEEQLNWRDRELFVDKSRGMAVVMGEKDNKKEFDKRKKNLIKEKMKFGKGVGMEEEVELNWEHYYKKVGSQYRKDRK